MSRAPICKGMSMLAKVPLSAAVSTNSRRGGCTHLAANVLKSFVMRIMPLGNGKIFLGGPGDQARTVSCTDRTERRPRFPPDGPRMVGVGDRV